MSVSRWGGITVGSLLGVFGGINFDCTLGGALSICTVRLLVSATLGGALVLPSVVGFATGLPLRASFLLVSGAFGIIFVTSSVSIVFANISASWHREASCCSAMGANGAAGYGFTKASDSCAAASPTASANVVVGMLYRYGKNSTVRAMRLDLVLVT